MLTGAIIQTAKAQYETDTIPAGVVPRSVPSPAQSAAADAPPLPTPPELIPPQTSTITSPVTPVEPGPQANTAPPAAPEPALILNAPPTTPDEKARFLTGRRLSPGSRISSIQSTPWYLDHARTFSTSWRRFDETYFSKMRAWSAMQVTPRIGNVRTLFYLFGGPDFINAFALFPEAQTYILGGLEPVGSLIPPEQLDETRLAAGLEGLRSSTSVTLQFSHFITRDMKLDLEKTDFKGVLPILLAFVSLGGAEVLDVRFFGIDRAGALQFGEPEARPAGLLPGVLVEFRQSPDAPVQSLYYIQADASDGALKANPALLTWMKSFAPGVSYLKAASYLLHEPYFSTVRKFLLEESRAVLQDDSGIPLRYFATGTWRVAFFGSYTGTLDIFNKYVQSDLLETYRGAGPVFPIEFGTGYKWQQGESNLMIAVKEGVPPQPGPPSESVPPPAI